MNSPWQDTTDQAEIPPNATSGEVEQAAPATSSVYTTFNDFQMEPIDGLSYKIVAGDEQVVGVTGADGRAPTLLGVTPGVDICLYVKNMYSGKYKFIGSVIAPAGEFPLVAVSAKVLEEVQTELHEGAAGTAAPLPITTETAKAKTTTPATAQRALENGRNKNGHPLAVSKPCPEWLERKLPAVCNLWTRADFHISKPLPPNGQTLASKSDGMPKSKIPRSGVGSAKSATPAPTHANNSVFKNGQWGKDTLFPWLFDAKPKMIIGLNEVESNKLGALIEFAERQVEIKYPFPDITSAEIKAKYAKHKVDDPKKLFPHTKDNDSIKRCLPYVKIALWRSGYVDGVTATIPAKDSGKDWESYGFKNISAELPCVEIAYQTKNGIVKHAQPDLSYTAPGDVIVYDQVAAPSAYGHVDIRTYHGFVSDFQWANYPAVHKYRVIGVYRKFSDTMALARVSAFLRIIRDYEAKGYKDPYHALHSDGKQHLTFSDWSTHPMGAQKSKPAGAYQIIYTTWEGICKGTGWPKTFDPEMQDRLAIFLLQERPRERMPHPRRSALGYIMENRIEKAVNETRLAELFAFLPGGGKQQQISMAELKALFDKYVRDYSK
jgi:muramidase (phage lysozyme)